MGEEVRMPGIYHEGNRRLQDQFDTRRLADRLAERTVHTSLTEGDRDFLARMDMFFLATADAEGRPTCSYKGGDPGFVRVIDERTVAFPIYDGNGMFLSMGNALANPHVGMLFIDFERARRMRIQGTATIDDHDPLLAEYPEAQMIVRVRVGEVFPNCPRYVHRYQLVERSSYVPHADCETPIPDWKRSDAFRDALPAADRARRLGPA
jgi:predicted pyridoxine 5'-phosphate oxidase superfamily flavin-nucleotide-binding protein